MKQPDNATNEEALPVVLVQPEAKAVLSDREIAEMLSDRELRERLKTEGDAVKLHELIANWEPLKSVA